MCLCKDMDKILFVRKPTCNTDATLRVSRHQQLRLFSQIKFLNE